VRIWILGSGSRGNAVLLESGESRVLVDAGFPVQELAARLAVTGTEPGAIEACVITHEHTDHVRGAAAAQRRWGWQLLATNGTASAAPSLKGVPVAAVSAGSSVSVGAWDLEFVTTSHDAAAPLGVVATERATGARAGVCYDLGVITDDVRSTFQDLDVLVLESNHDEGMLRAGPYPPSVAARIAGRYGHLSNRAAAEFAREASKPGLRHVVLAHLSESCNDPAIAADGARRALARGRFRGTVSVAAQDMVLGPLVPGAAQGRTLLGEQFSLGL